MIVFLGAALLMHRPLRGMLLSVVRLPLVVAESAVNTLLWLPQLPRLTHENATLRSELASRHLEFIRLQETVRHLMRANELTRAFKDSGLASSPFALSEPNGSKGSSETVVTSIIGRTLVASQHVVIVDKGMRDGVAVDSVLLDVNGLVGRLLEVHATTSMAMLLTDPNSRLACLVERSRESGLLVGTGGTLCQLIYLDLEADVVAGDRIVTAGFGGPFPKGVFVGTVVKVVRDERNAHAMVWVRPAVRLNQIEEVICIPPSQQSIAP